MSDSSPLVAGTRRSPDAKADPLTLDVLRVFTDGRGRFGNPLGVFLDGHRIFEAGRQGLAAELGYSETVFVDEPQRGELRMFTPAAELRLAGHPLVGANWLLLQANPELRILRPPAGDVRCWRERDTVWVRADPTQAPPWEHIELNDSQAVESLAGPPDGHDHVQVWAWQDERAGRVRARVFAPRFNVAEDEACGSASMILCRRNRRPVTVLHGRGSVIQVRPGPEGTIELGGRVEHAQRRSGRLIRTVHANDRTQQHEGTSALIRRLGRKFERLEPAAVTTTFRAGSHSPHAGACSPAGGLAAVIETVPVLAPQRTQRCRGRRRNVVCVDDVTAWLRATRRRFSSGARRPGPPEGNATSLGKQRSAANTTNSGPAAKRGYKRSPATEPAAGTHGPASPCVDV